MEYPSALSGLVLVVKSTQSPRSLNGGALKHMTTLRFEEASRYGRGEQWNGAESEFCDAAGEA